MKNILIIGADAAEVADVVALLRDRVKITFNYEHLIELGDLFPILGQRHWDLILGLDLHRPTQLLHTLAAHQPHPRLLLVMPEICLNMAVDLMRLGACGVVERSDHERLIELVEQEFICAYLTGRDSYMLHVQAILDTMLDAFTSFSLTDRRILFSSAAFERVLGYSLQCFVDDPNFFMRVVHPDDLDLAITMRQKALTDGHIEFEHRMLLPNGAVRWILRRSWVIFDDQGRPLIVNDHAHDITKHKQTEIALMESEQRLRLFVEHAPAAIAMFDRTMVYLLASRRYLEDYQLKDCAIIGRSHYDVFPEIPDYWREIHQRCLQGAVEKNEGEPFPRSDGRVDWVRWELHPWRDLQGEIGGLVLFSEVITQRVEALQAFKASEQRYRQMFEMHGLPKLIIALDTGQIINANPAAGRFYGYTVEQLKMLNIADLTFLTPEEVHQHIQQTINANMYSVECLHRGADGYPRHVEMFLGLLEFEGRQELYVLITDVTERQRTRKALQEAYDLMEQRVIARTIELQRYAAQVQDLYNNAPAGYHSLDTNGVFVQINDTELRWLGYTREEVLGKKYILELISPATRHVFERNFPIFKQQGWIKNLEFELVRKDGSIFPVLIDATAIFDDQGRFVHSRSTVYDMTERKQADDALRLAWQKEHELSELKSRFVSMASHEFRTPLAAILATTETLTIYRDRMNEAQIDARLDKIRQQVMHMKEIMEDVLQLARIQAGRMEFRPLIEDLDALCREIVEEYETQVRQPGRIAYSCPQRPVLAEIDPRLMRQIISNLISNALKYSAPQSSVCITLQREVQRVILTVTDQGIGIPPNDLKRLFDPFHRATNVGTIAGTGLGLSIAHQAIEMHHGTIHIASEVDQGTTMTVTIPLQTPLAKDG